MFKCKICKESVNKIDGIKDYRHLLSFTKVKLRFFLCKNCGYIYHSEIANREIDSYCTMKNYYYTITNIKKINSIYPSNFMTKINRIINKDRDLNILEIGSTNENFANFFLKSIDIKEYKYTIVDPHINNRFENLKNFRAINGFFDYHLFNNEKYDLIITNNLLEHIRDLNKFMEDVEKILKDNGIFIFQIPCLENDNIIESIVSLIADNHINYFSENNIKHIFSFFDMKVEFINFNGSIYATATKQKIVNKLEEYDKLRQKLKKKILLKKDFIKKIEQLRDKEVVIYGLTTASIPLLNRLEKIKYIIDDKYYNYKIIDKELISFKQFLDLQANRDFIVVPVSYSRESIVAMIKKI